MILPCDTCVPWWVCACWRGVHGSRVFWLCCCAEAEAVLRQPPGGFRPALNSGKSALSPPPKIFPNLPPRPQLVSCNPPPFTAVIGNHDPGTSFAFSLFFSSTQVLLTSRGVQFSFWPSGLWCQIGQCSAPKMKHASSLYEAMTTPAHGESKPQRVLAFKNALPQRQRKLKDALSGALTWLAEDPPPRPHPPPQGPNTWGKPNSTYSTSHTPPESPAPRYHPPPEGLPDDVKAPPPKKPRTHKCKNPMRPRPPPKRKADPNDKPAQRTRTDTFAPRAVAPAPPP